MMKPSWFRIIILGCFVLLLEGCDQAGIPDLTDEIQPPPAAPLPTSATQMPSEKDDTSTAISRSTPIILRGEIVLTPVSGDLSILIDTAKEDLARRLEITPDEIEVTRIEKAEWPDTSLGCAEPGLARRPVAIPGYRIILEVEGHEYIYHTDKKSGVVYCPKG